MQKSLGRQLQYSERQVINKLLSYHSILTTQVSPAFEFRIRLC